MSFVDRTEGSQTETLVFDVELAHPPEKVWRALTEPELMGQWLLRAVGFELEPGATFRLEAEPQPGWDGVVNCRVLEIEPRRRLSYTWTVPFLDTVVTFTLTPTATGTRLGVVQSGFREDQRREFGGARYGWRMMAQKLGDLLATLP